MATLYLHILTTLLHPAILYVLVFCLLSSLMVCTRAPLTKSPHNDKLPMTRDDLKKQHKYNEDDDEDSEETMHIQRQFLFRIGLSIIIVSWLLLLYQCVSLSPKIASQLPPACLAKFLVFWTIAIPVGVIALLESQRILPDDTCQYLLCLVLVIISYCAAHTRDRRSDHPENETTTTTTTVPTTTSSITVLLNFCSYHLNVASTVAIAYWSKNKKCRLAFWTSLAFLGAGQLMPIVCGDLETCRVILPNPTNGIVREVTVFVTEHFDAVYFTVSIGMICHAVGKRR